MQQPPELARRRASVVTPPTDDPGNSRLVELIRAEIDAGGPITFARFMERALYEPGLGYYAIVFVLDMVFGLFASISPRFAHFNAAIERADSVGADGHKWLNVPYDCGFAFVRDASALRAAFNATGAYIAPTPDLGWDPLAHSPEMSRRFIFISISSLMC